MGILLGLQVGCGKPESLRAKAEKGDAAAQNNLGRLYADGEGVPKDSAEAASWYREAADQGYAEAQFNLGVIKGSRPTGFARDFVLELTTFTGPIRAEKSSATNADRPSRRIPDCRIDRAPEPLPLRRAALPGAGTSNSLARGGAEEQAAG